MRRAVSAWLFKTYPVTWYCPNATAVATIIGWILQANGIELTYWFDWFLYLTQKH